jgi:type II secretion system protein J
MKRRLVIGKCDNSLKQALRAFTLIELVIAMAACAVILAAVYGVFSRAVHLRDDATVRIREARVRARAAAVLRNDLRNARVSGGTLAAALEGSQAGQSGGFPGYLRFTTTTAQDIVQYAQDIPANDIQRVEYYIASDPNAVDRKAGRLVRTVERDLLATVQTTPAEEPLLPGLESMEVAFYDGSSWQESWNYEESKTVPEAVRVRLQPAADESGATRPPIEVLVPWTTQVTVATEETTAEGGAQ